MQSAASGVRAGRAAFHRRRSLEREKSEWISRTSVRLLHQSVAAHSCLHFHKPDRRRCRPRHVSWLRTETRLVSFFSLSFKSLRV